MLSFIDPDEALRLVLQHTPDARYEQVPLAEAMLRVLVRRVVADRGYPPFDRAMMDGFAVRVADAGRVVPVAGEVAAGVAPQVEVAPGSAVAIMTGAVCPRGTEAVVPVEQVDRTDEGVGLPRPIVAGQHIVPAGSERGAGEVVVPAGTLIKAMELAVLAAVGCETVVVTARPTMAVISTGDEVVAAGTDPERHQIRNSNGPMLGAAARGLGLPRVTLLHADDTEDALHRALKLAEADIVLLSGGVSAGRYDLVPQVLQQAGASIVFHRVTQKPGKPLLLARRGDRLFFGLPGNPISSHFCFQRYVAAAVRRLTGRPEPAVDRGVLATDLSVRGERTLFLPARVVWSGDAWQVAPVVVGSGNIFACVDTVAYARLAPGEHRLKAGAAISFEWM